MFRFRNCMRIGVQIACRHSNSDAKVPHSDLRSWCRFRATHSNPLTRGSVAATSESTESLINTSDPFGDPDEFGTLPKNFEDEYIKLKKLERTKDKRDEGLSSNDPDVFGTLTKPESLRTVAESLPEDDDDDTSEDVILERPKLKEMEDKIVQLVKDRKMKEALNYFYEIKKLHRFKPTLHMYTRLIGGCGRVGYTKMAFKLYKEMRDRDMKMTPGTLTGLFNACAEGPFKEYSLQKAHNLYERMELKGWTPSNITYHAMIKAFGKCGDIQTAFRVVDKMKSEKHAITADTFAFLLMACISDKEAGFALGLKVMRMMLWKKIHPSLYCYNLFLRTVRECGVGPPELFHDLLESTVPKKKLAGREALNEKAEKMLSIRATEKVERLGHVAAGESYSDVTSDGESSDKERATTTPLDNPENLPGIPNLLSRSLQVPGEIVGLANVTEPYDRLLMCGGVKGVMDHLRDMGIHPDAKTVTLLLDCIPNTMEAEHELVAEADKMGVKLDVDFFNMLIKRRALRMQKSEAREVLTLITNRGLHPDIITFGVLALCIYSDKQGKEFLATMKNARMTVNEEILSTLIGNACFKFDFFFLLTLMNFATNQRVRVNPAALQHIEEAKQRVRKAMMDKERGNEVKYNITEYVEKGYTKFCLRYEEWLKEVTVDLPQHPWEQFKPENALKTRREFLEEAEKVGER